MLNAGRKTGSGMLMGSCPCARRSASANGWGSDHELPSQPGVQTPNRPKSTRRRRHLTTAGCPVVSFRPPQGKRYYELSLFAFLRCAAPVHHLVKSNVRFGPVADIGVELTDEDEVGVHLHWCRQCGTRPCHSVFLDLIEKPRMKTACQHPFDPITAPKNSLLFNVSVLHSHDIIPSTF